MKTCSLCKGSGIPPKCAINNIYVGCRIKDLLCGSIKKTPYLVCHKNAQSFENGIMHISDSCDSCGLCCVACQSNVIINGNNYEILEKALFNDLGKLNIFLSNSIVHLTVVSELKVDGNYREKRIDIVIKNENKYYFCKVLTSFKKYEFYKRSYDSVVSNLKETLSIDAQCLCLIPEALRLEASDHSYNCITIKELLGKVE